MATTIAKPMTTKVSAQLDIHCGCGFHAKDVKEAITHAEGSGHMLTVQGTIATGMRMAMGKVRVERQRRTK